MSHPVVGHEDVGESVRIRIRHRDAHAFPDVRSDPSRAGHVGEPAAAVVAVEKIREPLVVGGRAVHSFAFRTADSVILRRPVQVAGHEQVEVRIVVVVQPGRPHRPQFLGAGSDPRDTGPLRDVGERSVALVAIEDVPVHTGHVEVGRAIVVEVSGHGPHRVALAPDPRCLGHVAERPPAFVAIEPVPEAWVVLHEPRDSRAVREEDIEPAVVIEVEKGDSA